MNSLKTTHPDVWAYLNKGRLSVQLGNTFGKIPIKILRKQQTKTLKYPVEQKGSA